MAADGEEEPAAWGAETEPQEEEKEGCSYRGIFPLLFQQHDSARNLEWLKTVKESHGSVELSSLSLATAINDKGVYVIRAPKDSQKVSHPASWHSCQWGVQAVARWGGGGVLLPEK